MLYPAKAGIHKLQRLREIRNVRSVWIPAYAGVQRVFQQPVSIGSGGEIGIGAPETCAKSIEAIFIDGAQGSRFTQMVTKRFVV